jgi:23S rRNA pseudouridine1911/1915/1917 synthase
MDETKTPAEFLVAPTDAGRRLDAYLAERLACSRAATRRLLARGAVRIDGRLLDAAAKGVALRAGECIAIDSGADAETILPEPDLPLAVLAQGAGWLVVDKPAGMPVHPLAPGERGSLLGALVARHPAVQGVGEEGGLRSGVVHRLDVDTSGALLIATEAFAWLRLRAAFRAHRVGKTYRAIALGEGVADGEIALPLVVARHRPAFVRAARDDETERARTTHTRWRVLERLDGATLLEVETTTGFLHQVRATLAHLGHPLAGDRSYATSGDPTGAGRHMLHAASLRFEEIAATSPDPADFAALRARLGGAA